MVTPFPRTRRHFFLEWEPSDDALPLKVTLVFCPCRRDSSRWFRHQSTTSTWTWRMRRGWCNNGATCRGDTDSDDPHRVDAKTGTDRSGDQRVSEQQKPSNTQSGDAMFRVSSGISTPLFLVSFGEIANSLYFWCAPAGQREITLQDFPPAQSTRSRSDRVTTVDRTGRRGTLLLERLQEVDEIRDHRFPRTHHIHLSHRSRENRQKEGPANGWESLGVSYSPGFWKSLLNTIGARISLNDSTESIPTSPRMRLRTFLSPDWGPSGI